MNLTDETLVAFITTGDAQAARAFYEGVLGLTFVLDSEHLMIFQSGASRVALQKGASANVRPGTTLGWNVRDIRAAVRALAARGVVFEHFGMEQMPQDELGIWSPEPGHGVAWFKDPDGNTLSLSGPI
ncbi:MAG TPA: VOC family protein [Caulobacteraceae bacterium]|jgi:catechol 2,3-dioxygenase-like lactoylglutathione lyase family enzyme